MQLDQETLSKLAEQLKPFYTETLTQKDTYFATKEGRLKLREEKGKPAHLIRYHRPNIRESKECKYIFYPVNDVELFHCVLGDSLQEELVVKKQRALYFPKPHIRVHLDQVEELGNFLEIEIILTQNQSLASAKTEMRELQKRLQLDNLKKIHFGYRGLLQNHKFEQLSQRDLNYYKNQNKVF